MKIIIVGRSGAGKSQLIQYLAANGLRPLETSTTRPCRGPHDNGHKFLTKEQADAVPASDKLFQSNFMGHEYFASIADIAKADVMILDPQSVRTVTNAFPNTAFIVVNMTIGNEQTARLAVSAGSNNPEDDRAKYDAIRAAEEPNFVKFDAAISDDGKPNSLFSGDAFQRNCQISVTYTNNFDEDGMYDLTARLLSRMKAHENMTAIICQCAGMSILRQNKPGFISLWPADGNEPVDVSIDNAVEILLSEGATRQSAMASLITEWLSHNLTIGVPLELIPD